MRVNTLGKLPLAWPLRKILRELLVMPVTTSPVDGAASNVGGGGLAVVVGRSATDTLTMLRVLMSPLGVMKSATPQPVRPSGVTTSNHVPSTVRPVSVMGVFVASCVMILPVVPGDSRTRRYWQVAQTLAVSTAV